VIRSMTGFGDAASTVDGVHCHLEVRSLNNKYFKASIRLPDELQHLEPEIESGLRRRLTRGSIVCSIKLSSSSATAALDVNHHALERYIDQLEKVSQVASGSMSISLGPLLHLPGVLQPATEDGTHLKEMRSQISALLDEACDHLVSMRQREGLMLIEDLMGHHTIIADRLSTIAERAPLVVADYQDRLRQRIEALLEEVGRKLEPADLIKEVAIFAERSDIAEEITRLGAHMDQFSELLDDDDERPIGRTLDFLTQEMLREANTIASKSSDAGISRAIVEVKGAIDRIKEQVQNVE
jgi:uncharacterized protein (TIGR00255 family)